MDNTYSPHQLIRSALFAGLAALGSAPAAMAEDTKGSTAQSVVTLNPTWDKTFPQSSKVEHHKVTFKNRYGLTLAGDLYLPRDHGSQPLPTLVISGPFGAVKEQASGLYAQTMAERGYVALAFDPSYTGESSGEPRNLASPDINTEDFSAAVDFLGWQPSVDRKRIGIIGICGFGGMGLNAAAADPRIKAVVTTAMYDMSRVMAKGLNDSLTPEQRAKMLEQLGEQRWADSEQGIQAPGPRILPEKLSGDDGPIIEEFFDYYRTPRGYHPHAPNSSGAWTATTALPFMNMPLLTYIADIAPRPILLIAGEHAHSRYFSEDAFKAAAQPKELLIVKDANHVDLYDRMDKIPFDTIADFFGKHLK